MARNPDPVSRHDHRRPELVAIILGVARRIRWLGVGMVACFFVLFLQLNNLQVVKAHQYATFLAKPHVLAARRRPSPEA